MSAERAVERGELLIIGHQPRGDILHLKTELPQVVGDFVNPAGDEVG